MASRRANDRRTAVPDPGKYELDRAHTAVEFVARHILTKVRGRFTDFSGWVDVAEPIEESSVHVEVKTASIQTNTEQRDEHLKSDDFLNVEKFPVMTFQSTGIRHTAARGFELDGRSHDPGHDASHHARRRVPRHGEGSLRQDDPRRPRRPRLSARTGT